MDFKDLKILPASQKLLLAMFEVAYDAIGDTWTNTGGGAYYLGNFPNAAISKVESDGVDLTEVYSVSDCESLNDSFFYDFSIGRVYVRIGENVNPSLETTILLYHFENFNDKNDGIIFEREQEALLDPGLEDWASSTDLTNYTEVKAGASTVTREASIVYDGGYSVKVVIDGGGNNGYILQTVKLPPRARCKLRFWRRHSDPSNPGFLRIRDTGSNVYLNSSSLWQAGATSIPIGQGGEAINTWIEDEIEFYVNEDYAEYYFEIGGKAAAAGETIYLDKFRFTIYREANPYKGMFNPRGSGGIQQGVADYHTGSLEKQSVSLSFLNAGGYFWEKLEDFIWYNKDCSIYIGETDSAFEDMKLIFKGRVKDHAIDTESCVFGVVDERTRVFKNIPTERYDTATFPNIKSQDDEKVRRILYGSKTNITPIYLNTSTYLFEIAAHEHEAISAVYYDEKIMTGGGVDYTADLANGQFTLTANPEKAHITCDAKGRKCDLEDGTFSELVADILFDILINYNSLPKSQLDLEFFLDLKAARTQELGIYINSEINVWEIIRKMQATSLFHFIPLLNGVFSPRKFTSNSEGVPELFNYDYDSFGLNYQSPVFKSVRIKFDQDPTTGKYKTILRTKAEAGYQYKEEDTQTIETYNTDSAEAQTLADFYLDYLQQPAKKADIKTSIIGFGWIPSDVIKVSRTRKDDSGNDIIIAAADIYSALKLVKSLSDSRVSLVARDISQISELAHTDSYEDIEHVDNHTDGAYSDVAHEDSSHADSHGDSYTDVVHQDIHSDGYADTEHQDVTYVDTPHVDEPHIDVPHDDSYTDHGDDFHTDEHGDEPYDDLAHSDAEHSDTPHTDVPHIDTHTDDHGDSHTDTHTDTYSDASHADEAHTDEAHADEYEDIPHIDNHSDS